MRQYTTLHEKYIAMCNAQRANDDFDLHLWDLARVWGYASPNTVLFHLRRLHAAGLVKMKDNGGRCRWRVVEAETAPVETQAVSLADR